jgi:hypothetical protein
MKSGIPLIAMISCTALLLACDQPTEPQELQPVQAAALANGAERSVYEETYQLDGDIYGVFCEDGTLSEPIAVSGTVMERITFTRLPSGGFHSSFTVRSYGLQGIGVETGARYRISEAGHSVANQNGMREGGSYHAAYRVESMELGKSYRFRVQANYSFNANGELVVERERVTEACEL